MSFNDRPIHLSQYSICSRQPNADDSVVVPVWITQSNLDGLQAMIQFCGGLEVAGKGRVPGSFELVMFYRQLQSAIRDAEEKAKTERKVSVRGTGNNNAGG